MVDNSLLIFNDAGFSLYTVSSYSSSVDFYTRVGNFLEHFDVSLDDLSYFHTKIYEKTRKLL